MEKKTISISEQYLISLAWGVFLSILSVTILHFFGNWSANPYTDNYSSSRSYGAPERFLGTDYVSSYDFTCLLGGYHTFKGDGKVTLNDVFKSSSGTRISGALSSVFDDHWLSLLIISIAFSLIIMFFKRYDLVVSNDTSPKEEDLKKNQ